MNIFNKNDAYSNPKIKLWTSVIMDLAVWNNSLKCKYPLSKNLFTSVLFRQIFHMKNLKLLNEMKKNNNKIKDNTIRLKMKLLFLFRVHFEKKKLSLWSFLKCLMVKESFLIWSLFTIRCWFFFMLVKEDKSFNPENLIKGKWK